MRQEYQCKLSRTTLKSSAFGKCQSWQEVMKADVGEKLAGFAAINQSSAQLNTQNIYKMWGNIVDTQANTLTHKATYIKKKKGPRFSRRKFIISESTDESKKMKF